MTQPMFSFMSSSLVMTAIIAMTFAIHTFFPKTFSAKIRYRMWIVVLLWLIIPIRPSIGNGIISLPFFTQAESTTTLAGAEEEQIVLDIPLADVVNDPVAQENTAFLSLSFTNILLIVWGVGAIITFSYHLLHYIQFTRTINRWGFLEEDEQVLTTFHKVQAKMGLQNKKIRLMTCSVVSTSLLTGFLRPVVILPEKNFELEELELIFRHEFIHYKRHDLFIKLLSLLAVSIHWFNPFVYLMSAALQAEGEASCDQDVIQHTGEKNRHFYAEIIIGMIGGKHLQKTFLSTNFYGGKKGIKKRLESIIDASNHISSLSYFALAFVIVITIFSGSVFASPLQAATRNSEVDYFRQRIEMEEAQEIALSIIGGGTIQEIETSYANETPIFNVTVLYDHHLYAVTLHATTGEIIGLQTGNFDENLPFNEATEEETREISQSPISSNTAIQIAKNLVSGDLVEVDRDVERGRAVWYVAIRSGSTVHEIYIDMETGEIVLHETYNDN